MTGYIKPIQKGSIHRMEECMDRIISFGGYNIQYDKVCSAWRCKVEDNNRMLISGLRKKYGDMLSLYEIISSIVKADDLDSMKKIVNMYIGYIPIQWNHIILNMENNTMISLMQSRWKIDTGIEPPVEYRKTYTSMFSTPLPPDTDVYVHYSSSDIPPDMALYQIEQEIGMKDRIERFNTLYRIVSLYSMNIESIKLQTRFIKALVIAAKHFYVEILDKYMTEGNALSILRHLEDRTILKLARFLVYKGIKYSLFLYYRHPTRYKKPHALDPHFWIEYLSVLIQYGKLTSHWTWPICNIILVHKNDVTPEIKSKFTFEGSMGELLRDQMRDIQ